MTISNLVEKVFTLSYKERLQFVTAFKGYQGSNFKQSYHKQSIAGRNNISILFAWLLVRSLIFPVIIWLKAVWPRLGAAHKSLVFLHNYKLQTVFHRHSQPSTMKTSLQWDLNHRLLVFVKLIIKKKTYTYSFECFWVL